MLVICCYQYEHGAMPLAWGGSITDNGFQNECLSSIKYPPRLRHAVGDADMRLQIECRRTLCERCRGAQSESCEASHGSCELHTYLCHRHVLRHVYRHLANHGCCLLDTHQPDTTLFMTDRNSTRGRPQHCLLPLFCGRSTIPGHG